MENTETSTTKEITIHAPRQRVQYPDHWRKTFAVPLNDAERKTLKAAAERDGKPLATWIRMAALALAACTEELPPAAPTETPTAE